MSSSVNILAPTEALSQLIWCEIVNEDTLRIRCNKCNEKFYQGSHYDHVNPSVDWLGTAITHIVTVHERSLT